MKRRDQKRGGAPRAYHRKIHFGEGEVWSYRFAGGHVTIRTPDCGTTHRVPLPEISGMSHDEMERGEWKGWWRGVGPQRIKDYITLHLRPEPDFRIPDLVFMHPHPFGRWHLFWDCHFLPHRKHQQAIDPARVFAEELERRLGEPATRLNCCGVCMRRHHETFSCMDCHRFDAEYYMVWDTVWRKAVPDGKGKLCFSCLEKRLGRPLHRGDFNMRVPLNQVPPVKDLIARMPA